MRTSTKVLTTILAFWLICYWHVLNPYSNAQGGSPVTSINGSGISGLTTNRMVRAASATTVGNSGCSTDDSSSVIICPGADGTTAVLIDKADGSTHVVNIDTTNSRVCIGCTSVNPLYPFVVGNTNSTLVPQAGASPTTTAVFRSAADTGIGVQTGAATSAASFNFWNSANTLGADFEYDFNSKILAFVTRVSGAKTVFFSDVATQAMQTNGGRIEVNSAIVAIGTKFTISGCSADTTVGGAFAGTFVSRTTGTCTVVITLNGATGATAPNGWACHADDRTTPANLISQSSSTTTTCTVTGATITGDVLSFMAIAY